MPWPPSGLLACVALTLWVTSLALTGIAHSSGSVHWRGIELLIYGWLSPLVFNFAWFANLAFAWGLISVSSGGVPVRSSLLCVLLALDTVRFTTFPLGEATSPVYGYGWGAVFWFASISLLVAATGTRQIERRIEENDDDYAHEWLRPVGFFLAVLVLFTGVYWFTHDHGVANEEEAAQLAGLVFKRGSVCGEEVALVVDPVDATAGPLQVDWESTTSERQAPFDRPTALLGWGIPVIRMAGRDYSYERAGDEWILTSVPASSAAASTLFVTTEYKRGYRRIGARLVEAGTGRVVFDQTWQSKGQGQTYCPGYRTLPSAHQQPRRLLLTSLGLAPDESTLPTPGLRFDGPPRDVVQATYVPPAASTTTLPLPAGGTSPLGAYGRGLNADWRCGSAPAMQRNVGRDDPRTAVRDLHLHAGKPMMVGDKAYFHPFGYSHVQAMCVGDHAYFFAAAWVAGRHQVHLDRRRLSDFRKTGFALVVIDHPGFARDGDDLRVQTLAESDGRIQMLLSNARTGDVASFVAAIPER